MKSKLSEEEVKYIKKMAKKHNKNLVTDYSIFKFSIASSSNLFSGRLSIPTNTD
jgi:hypothetical protein